LKHLFAISLFFLLTGNILIAQNSYLLTGTVKDSITHEPLIGATVYIKDITSGTSTDTNGYFSLRLAKGTYSLQITYIGYVAKSLTYTATGSSRLDIFLSPMITETQEVIVTAKNPDSNTESAKTGFVELSGKDIKNLPSLMGESDLIRALHYSPGVQSAGDGNTGFYVRGGNVDQNLILLDNAMVYNPSHVLGFFSIFNADIVSNAVLIKSGIPSGYGGRISSVLAVKTIDGNFEKHTASATLGLIYSKATIQGPIIRNKLSYLVSFRRTYINEVVKPIIGLFMDADSGSALSGSRYGMYDLTLKLSFKPGPKHKFSLLAYNGRDNFNLNRDDIDYKTRINWGNTLFAFNWNYMIGDSSYLINSLNYSMYDFNYVADQYIIGVDLYSSIKNMNYKLEYTRNTAGNGIIKAGGEAKYYTFIPNRFMLSVNDEKLNYSTYQDLYAGEFAVFASWEKELAKRFLVYAGLRLNNYRQFGPYYEINRIAGGAIQDTSSYQSLETIKSYSGLEPRLSVRYRTSASSSVKASYTRNYQFIHVASASSVTLPSDIWIPSTSHTRPQYGDQFTLGYYRNFMENTYVASAEAYYKKLSNQVELLYGLGASLQDVSFEKSLATGKGYSTGIEFFVQKQKTKFTGSLGYSLSYTERQFDEINNGKPFPAKYDRRHEINMVAGFNPDGRWDFSVSFVYATGNAMTVPVQIYWFNSTLNTEYSETNAFRMPAYHRMDVSATYNFKKHGTYESSLNFSVFNVYNRANPFLIYFDIKGDIVNDHSLSISVKQISIAPVLPSVSWNLKF
jgi:hypothetical protein